MSRKWLLPRSSPTISYSNFFSFHRVVFVHESCHQSNWRPSLQWSVHWYFPLRQSWSVSAYKTAARAPFFGSSKRQKSILKNIFPRVMLFFREISLSRNPFRFTRERERERERTKFECQFWSKKSFQFEKGNEKHENRFIFKLSFGFGFLNPISELDLALNRCLICI